MHDPSTSAEPTSSAQSAYNQWHAQFGEDDHADSPWHLLVRRYLRPADLDGKRVLEIGCGRGGFTLWLATQPTRPQEIVAADFSATAVEMATDLFTKRGLNNVTACVQDIERISLPDASFDTVVSCETIEHVPNPQQAIKELYRVLKPGGRLYLTTPNYLGTMGLYRAYLRLRGRRFTEVGQPINQLTFVPRTLSWLRHSGFQVTVVDGAGHYLPIPGRPPLRWVAPDRWPFGKYFSLHSFFACIRRG